MPQQTTLWQLSLVIAIASNVLLIGNQGNRGQTGRCVVEIGFPAPDARVGGDGDVKGTLRSAPAGTHLWLLAQRRGLGLWWPQSGGEVRVERDGAWTGFVTYGLDRDQGRQFEVLAIVVDEPTHANLSKWIAQAEATGRYPGISLPRVIDTCNTARLVVTRS